MKEVEASGAAAVTSSLSSSSANDNKLTSASEPSTTSPGVPVAAGRLMARRAPTTRATLSASASLYRIHEGTDAEDGRSTVTTPPGSAAFCCLDAELAAAGAAVASDEDELELDGCTLVAVWSSATDKTVSSFVLLAAAEADGVT